MRRALLAATLATAICAAAQGEPARALLEQKEALVRRLLNDSPAAARIEASGNSQARAHFASARELHATATRMLASGDLASAELQLNDALWMAGKARQLVPDPMQRAIELRVQNRAMMRAIESLRASYRQHAPADARLARIDARIDEALGFSHSEHVQQAHELLRAAERELMTALAETLAARTIDYRPRFEAPGDEFAHELARTRAYEELLPIAQRTLKPAPEAVARMERAALASARLVDRARDAAARSDYAAALGHVREATTQLQAALAAAGVTP